MCSVPLYQFLYSCTEELVAKVFRGVSNQKLSCIEN